MEAVELPDYDGEVHVVRTQPFPHPEGDQVHDYEVEKKRNGDAHHIQRQLDDQVPFEAEHDHYGEEQGDQSEGADLRHELPVVPLLAHDLDPNQAGQRPGNTGNPQIDEHALGDLADADIHHHPLQPHQRRQHGDEEPGVDAIEEHLEDAVEGHQTGGNGDVGGADLKAVDEGFRAGDEVTETDSQRHGGKDPEGQPTVEKGEFAGQVFGHNKPHE